MIDLSKTKLVIIQSGQSMAEYIVVLFFGLMVFVIFFFVGIPEQDVPSITETILGHEERFQESLAFPE